jgi:hypothetical protein
VQARSPILGQTKIHIESADGRSLFLADAFENARIQRLTLGQGDLRPLAGIPRVRYGTSWEVTREGIYYVEAGSPQAAIGYFEFATDSTRELARLSHQIVPWTGLSVSPVDRSVLYSQTDEKSSEIMLAEFGNGVPSRAGTPP